MQPKHIKLGISSARFDQRLEIWLKSKMIMRLSVSVLCVLLLVDYSKATLDLTNIDWKNFQFFRYETMFSNGEVKNVQPSPSSIQNHFQKKFAVGTYIKRLLFGYTGDDGKTISMPFAPTVDHLRQRFQQRYGYRGEYLIEQLGNGNFRYSSGHSPCRSCRYH